MWKQFSGNAMLGGLACAALLLLTVRAQQGDALPGWVTADWQYWTQGSGRWIADNSAYKAPNEPFDAYGTEWKLGLGKKSLKGRLFAVRDGKEVGTIWEFHSYWHPAEKRVVLLQFGSDGTFATGTMRVTGEKMTESLERFFDPAGKSTQLGHRAELHPGEARMQSYDVSEDGTWTQRRYYVWKLQPPAK